MPLLNVIVGETSCGLVSRSKKGADSSCVEIAAPKSDLPAATADATNGYLAPGSLAFTRKRLFQRLVEEFIQMRQRSSIRFVQKLCGQHEWVPFSITPGSINREAQRAARR
jgi:hypothetical protein